MLPTHLALWHGIPRLDTGVFFTSYIEKFRR